jgi:hypothetical protein
MSRTVKLFRIEDDNAAGSVNATTPTERGQMAGVSGHRRNRVLRRPLPCGEQIGALILP